MVAESFCSELNSRKELKLKLLRIYTTCRLMPRFIGPIVLHSTREMEKLHGHGIVRKVKTLTVLSSQSNDLSLVHVETRSRVGVCSLP